MMSVSLIDEFCNLPKSTSYEDLEAVRISKDRNDFLAKGPDGEPIFLLNDSSPIRYVVGRNLKHIKAEFHVTCGLKTGNDYINGQFAVISCEADSPELHEIFLRCVGASIEVLPTVCETADLENVIGDLLEIFRALSEPSDNDISGFWAELWVIANSSNIPLALQLWHSDVYDRYDFFSTETYIEVKATTKNFRIHDFALEQLNGPENGQGIVISVMLQQLSGGSSVLDLVYELENSVHDSPYLKRKLWTIVTKSLGKDFSEKIDKRFDMAFAARNVQVHSMHDIPSLGPLNDARISKVRFSVDLTTVPQASPGSAREILARCFSPGSIGN